VPDTLRCYETEHDLTGASLPQIRRSLARAWVLMLASRIDEALSEVERIELQLGDLSPALAGRFRTSTQLLRAAGLAFQDDSRAALAIAVPHSQENATGGYNYVASTVCRLAYWRLGRFDSLRSLPRHKPQVRWSKSRAMSAMLDLSIEAAVALDHLQLSIAKRLASEALNIVETTTREATGLAALPACILAQVLYQEGSLDQADRILRDRLPAIKAEGSVECAWRAYLVLVHIANHRMQYDFAALLLREAEVLGERRGWSRLVMACLAERTRLLLQGGQTRKARLCFDYLERYAETHPTGSECSSTEILRYRTLTRWRVSWAEAPSVEAVAAIQRFYHQSVERRNLARASRLAVELAQMLPVIGKSEEADALFFNTVRAGAAAGLYQIFLEGGAELGMLLRQAYWRAESAGPADREVLPFVGSVLSRWDAHHAGGGPARPRSRINTTLTARECDILVLVGQGSCNKAIARTLKISPETVKYHLKNAFLKLAVSTRAEALSRAGSLGLL
jgi:ATP/maltotriose-dependent transcriptional regulator MalT